MLVPALMMALMLPLPMLGCGGRESPSVFFNTFFVMVSKRQWSSSRLIQYCVDNHDNLRCSNDGWTARTLGGRGGVPYRTF